MDCLHLWLCEDLCQRGTEVKQGDYLSSPLHPHSASYALIEVSSIALNVHRHTMTFIADRAVLPLVPSLKVLLWFSLWLVADNIKRRHNVASFWHRAVLTFPLNPEFFWEQKQLWSSLPTINFSAIANDGDRYHSLSRESELRPTYILWTLWTQLSLTPSPTSLTGYLRKGWLCWISQFPGWVSRSVTSFGLYSKKSSFIQRTKQENVQHREHSGSAFSLAVL